MEEKIAVDLVQHLRIFGQEHAESGLLCRKNCSPDKEAAENHVQELLQIDLVDSGNMGLGCPLDQDSYFADREVTVPAFAWTGQQITRINIKRAYP